MKQEQWQKAFPEPPKRFHNKMEATLKGLPSEKEHKRMGIKKRFLVPVLALVAVLALGTGLLATGTISSIVGSSSAKPTYTELPTAAELTEALEFTPMIPAAFANGYTFENATVGTQAGVDDDGNTVDSHKNINVLYKKGNAELNLYAEKWAVPLEENGEVTKTYQGIDLIYSANTYKFLPPDYEMTAQDKADEASGKYIFSFGSDQEEISEIQGLTWVMEGITYNLLAVDSEVTQGDLLTMAEEIINQ